MISDTVLIAMITGVPATLGAIGTFVNTIRLNRVQRTTLGTRHAVNGRMDELLTAHGEVQYQRGLDASKSVTEKGT